jgi:hypothetical protein
MPNASQTDLRFQSGLCGPLSVWPILALVIIALAAPAHAGPFEDGFAWIGAIIFWIVVLIVVVALIFRICSIERRYPACKRILELELRGPAGDAFKTGHFHCKYCGHLVPIAMPVGNEGGDGGFFGGNGGGNGDGGGDSD